MQIEGKEEQLAHTATHAQDITLGPPSSKWVMDEISESHSSQIKGVGVCVCDHISP